MLFAAWCTACTRAKVFTRYTLETPRFFRKLRHLTTKKKYAAGKLDFLLQEIEPAELVDRLYPFQGESHEQRKEREIVRKEADRQAARERLPGLPQGHPLRESLPDVLDSSGYHRMEVIVGLPEIDWSVRGLEKAHIPGSEALTLLSEYDELHITLVYSQVRIYDDERRARHWMADFQGIDRYVALHYLVQFAADNENAPYPLLEKAAALKAKGDLELDNRLQAAGSNLMRYEVWRGRDYLTAYLEATKQYYGTKKQRDRLERESSAILEPANERENLS